MVAGIGEVGDGGRTEVESTEVEQRPMRAETEVEWGRRGRRRNQQGHTGDEASAHGQLEEQIK